MLQDRKRKEGQSTNIDNLTGGHDGAERCWWWEEISMPH
jgi:hypothetical protein